MSGEETLAGLEIVEDAGSSTGEGSQARSMRRSGTGVLPLQALSWTPRIVSLALLLLVLAAAGAIGHRQVYLGLDSIGHYVHVWFVHHSLFGEGTLPLTNPYLQSGEARAFPYGFVPYMITALLYHVFADRAVSVLMALLAAAIIAVAGYSRLRKDPVLIACFALSLPFLDGLLSFQFIFFWAALFFFLFAWALDRRRTVLAGVLMWATMVTHPIIGLEAVVIYTVYHVRAQPVRRPIVLRMAVVTGLCALPTFVYSLGDPSAGEAPKLYLAAKVIVRSAFGLAILFGPFLLLRWRAVIHANYARVFALVCTSSLLWFAADQSSCIGLFEDAQSMYTGFFDSGRFQRGAVYRILEPEDREEGQYFFVQKGAVLANSFFTETMFRQDWESLEEYTAFLREERIDFVVVEQDYFEDFDTNEGELLDRLVTLKQGSRTYADPEGRFEVFDVKAPLMTRGDGAGLLFAPLII